MPTIIDLQTLLQAEFDGPKAASFATYGGVNVALAVIENTEEKRVGRPRLVLDVESDGTSRWSGARELLRDVVVRFTAQANDFNGAIVPSGDPLPVQCDIADAVEDYFVKNASTLHNAGYMMPEMRREQGQTAGLISRVSGRISWTYQRQIS